VNDLEEFLKTASRDDIARELRRVEAQLEPARRRRDAAAISYAATPDGAAETFRRFELATNADQRTVLKSIYLAGLVSAAEEFGQREKLGNATPTDGPLEVIPVGVISDPVDPVVRVLVEHRIMGTYRSCAAAAESGQVTVALLRLAPDGVTRKRCSVISDASCGVFTDTLSDVVLKAWAQPEVRRRLASFLGEDAEAALADAVALRAG
jgi:hypothetical protein